MSTEEVSGGVLALPLQGGDVPAHTSFIGKSACPKEEGIASSIGLRNGTCSHCHSTSGHGNLGQGRHHTAGTRLRSCPGLGWAAAAGAWAVAAWVQAVRAWGQAVRALVSVSACLGQRIAARSS